MISRTNLWIVQNRETGEEGLLVTHPCGGYCFIRRGTYLEAMPKKALETRIYSIAEILVLFRPCNRSSSRLLKASLDLIWGPTFDNDTLSLFPELEGDKEVEKTDG